MLHYVMFIRWLSYTSRAKSERTRHDRRDHLRLTPVLVESVRIDGKPRQRHIATLHSLGIKSPFLIWESITVKLDSLGNRLTPEERARIEAQIADMVPCPPREQYLRWKEACIARFGGRHRPALENWPG